MAILRMSAHLTNHEFKDGNYSDLEAISPLPRHSWDHISHCGSLYLTLSLGRATCSPKHQCA